MTVPKDYIDVVDFLKYQFEEVNGYDFYIDLFPNNECVGELNNDYLKPNAIYLYDDSEKKRLKRRIMLADTWEDDYMTFIEGNGMTLCSGLTYRGFQNRLNNAQNCNAIIIDLDGVGRDEIDNLFYVIGKPADQIRSLPVPTYVAASGTGLHVYYFLDQPLALFPNIKVQLKALKHDLVFRMWNWKATSKIKSIQYQSINQGFRMIGSINNKYGVPIRAFRTGDRVSIDYLNQYVSSKVDVQQRFKPSKMTKAEAKIKFPEWYNRVFDDEGNPKRDVISGKWDIAGKVHGDDPQALYHWWLRQIENAKAGHRYFYMMCAAIYAFKCDLPKKQLKDDLKDVFNSLKLIEHTNPLTQADVDAALEAYSSEYYKFSIDSIEKLSDIRIEKNKRNGRDLSTHLKIARFARDLSYPDGAWINRDGRPKGKSKQRDRILQYREEHPNAKPKDCINDLKISKNTVYRWWSN